MIVGIREFRDWLHFLQPRAPRENPRPNPSALANSFSVSRGNAYFKMDFEDSIRSRQDLQREVLRILQQLHNTFEPSLDSSMDDLGVHFSVGEEFRDQLESVLGITIHSLPASRNGIFVSPELTLRQLTDFLAAELKLK